MVLIDRRPAGREVRQHRCRGFHQETLRSGCEEFAGGTVKVPIESDLLVSSFSLYDAEDNTGRQIVKTSLATVEIVSSIPPEAGRNLRHSIPPVSYCNYIRWSLSAEATRRLHQLPIYAIMTEETGITRL